MKRLYNLAAGATSGVHGGVLLIPQGDLFVDGKASGVEEALQSNWRQQECAHPLPAPLGILEGKWPGT